MKSPLRIAREKMGLRLQDIAQQVGSDVGNLSRIERGKQVPTRDLAEKICGVFPPGEITEMHLIYPERYLVEPEQAAQ
ncbi:helix-turn-helix transcriptional regulator [Herbaspirillum sp. RU 5E]|nr:helix-turn-helix transcriptional regulator [Herbaspirillum sp. RU 5E]